MLSGKTSYLLVRSSRMADAGIDRPDRIRTGTGVAEIIKVDRVVCFAYSVIQKHTGERI